MTKRIGGWWVLVAVSLALAGTSPVRAGHSVYLALGDSITFGVGADDSASDVSSGDRGYVGRYADALMSTSGGVRPTIINLAISGETSSSFFGPVGTGIDGPGAPARNVHYLTDPTLTQEKLMLQTIQQQLGAGNTIDHVTITLGANDLFLAVATGADFGTTLTNFVVHEITLLTEIRGALPTADMALLNYYDPYAPFRDDPTSPYYGLAQASALAIPALNGLIADQAAAFQARLVDVSSLFPATTVLDETYISQGGNVHPKNAGYDRIAAATGAVPEPASLIMVSLGGLAVLASRRCRGGAITAA